MTMLTLIEQIRARLRDNAYVNEAAISHGIVTPILNALGWDSADPRQLVPEYANTRGRVDFALIGLGRKPAVFVEVKAVGKAMDGDRQLFEYAFHEGVPICVLTDGREWSFYLPSGQGSYEERRVYLLQLDEREPEECARVLTRYLSRDRVRDQSAFKDAQRELDDAASRREASATIPRAWADLLASPEDSLVEIVAARAEEMCGFKPDAGDVLAHLRSLRSRAAASVIATPPISPRSNAAPAQAPVPASSAAPAPITTEPADIPVPDDLTVTFTLFGRTHACENASQAMKQILSVLADRDPSRLPLLADRVRTPSFNWVATSPQEIAPGKPQQSRGLEFRTGWWIGTHMSNKSKMNIIRAAASVFELGPDDLKIDMRNG